MCDRIVTGWADGYAGGYTPNPTYEEVCTGRTSRTEAVATRHVSPCATPRAAPRPARQSRHTLAAFAERASPGRYSASAVGCGMTELDGGVNF